MTPIAQTVQTSIKKIGEALSTAGAVILMVVFVLLSVLAALWFREEVYVNAKMDTPGYLARVRSLCKKAEGCLAVNPSVTHMWATDATRFRKYGTHMQIDLVVAPQMGQKVVASMVSLLPVEDREFLQFQYPGMPKPDSQ